MFGWVCNTVGFVASRIKIQVEYQAVGKIIGKIKIFLLGLVAKLNENGC